MTKEFFENGKKIAKWADNNMKQHKWHKEIKAWADGAEIEYRYGAIAPNTGKVKGAKWYLDVNPDWDAPMLEYRVKSQPVEPQYLYVYQGQDGNTDVSLDSNCPFKYWTLKGKIKLESNDG